MATPQTNGTTKPQPVPSRMTLASVVKGKRARPIRALLYGVEGIGKSTFAASAPAPIFIGAEDGTDHLDAVRFPTPGSWNEVFEALRVLATQDHPYQTLAIDTLDWLEPLAWDFICTRDGVENIEAYGYGKGYVAALDEWRRFLAALERLRETKGMHVVLLAHSWIKPFKNPEGDDFDRYEMKLNAKAGGLLKEWSDVVLFANYETYAEKDKRTKRVKGVSTGARMLYTTRTAAYDAKNRYDLPDSMPLDWGDFFAGVQSHRPADPKALAEEIQRKAEQVGGEVKEKALAFLAEHAGDAAALAKLNDRINAKLAEKREAEGN
jgi:hypothetical protein